jgi:hypothetical protein
MNDTCNDGGLFPYATIGDTVWNDANANGIQDVGEPRYSGVRVSDRLMNE